MDVDAVPLFRVEGISKRYGGVRALEKAELTVHAGRVHAILGENGAGKSTLIKIMAGVVQPDEGRMMLAGSEARFARPAEANAAGIACILPELSLIPALARAGAEDVHPLAPVKDLPLSRRQMVEIAKALARNPKILILDEATSALTAADVVKVFTVLKRLRGEGLALLYISHRMHEIAE